MTALTTSRTAGWVALVISVAGIMTHPEILGLLPEKWAVAVSGIGIILQAITKSLINEQ